MRNNDPWKDTAFASKYIEEAMDPNLAWYEHIVNFPSILDMLPLNAQAILDFGCGPGDYTNQLSTRYMHKRVEGSDTSEAMLDVANRDHPNISFFIWDFHAALPAGHRPYDVVIAKLAVQFIEDLEDFAQAISDVLTSGGTLIISVPHPSKTMPKVANYWQQTNYEQQIGVQGISDMMIHRSIEQYITTFTALNYFLTNIREPRPTREILERYHADAQDFAIPKRLNMAFRKV